MDPENVTKFKHREKGAFKKPTKSLGDLWGNIKPSMCIYKCQEEKKGVGQNTYLKK